MNPRAVKRQAEICLELVRELERAVIEAKQPADQHLALFYRQHREYGSRDRRFFSNAVFSWFRWRGWLKTPEKENIAAAILLDADEIPPQLEYFGLNQTLADLKPAGQMTLEEKAEYLRDILKVLPPRQTLSGQTKPVAGLAEAGLLTETVSSQAGPGSPPPATIALVPDWVPNVLFIPEKIDPELHLRRCIQAFQIRPPTWLRLPVEKTQDTVALLREAGIEVALHPSLKQAGFIKGANAFDAARFPQIQVQDIASQCVGICCAPKPGEQWWDVCAGSGGKSLHLADLMQDKGTILATDIRPAILDQLSKRLRQNKYQSIHPLLWDGKSDPMPGKYFDGVLVDAPCSGLGTWARNPDARWRAAPEQVQEFAAIQGNLLQIAAGKVKPGGRLIYSTCTLTRIENTDVIQSFLDKHPEFKLETTANPLTLEPTNGIIWIWPWEGNCNGMFMVPSRIVCKNI